MNVIFDASCAINLIYGRQIENVVALEQVSFFMGPIALGECERDREILQTLIDGRKLTLLDDRDISASLYIQLLQKFGLGEGETECLAACASGDFHMACDDRKARKTCMNLYGANRTSGSLALLKHCVQSGSLAPDEAKASVDLMKQCGAFLPEIGEFFFQAT